MKKQRKPGFTLIELISALVLTTIVATAFFYALVYGVQQYVQSYQTASLAQKARLALTRMHVELTEIQDIDQAHSGNIDGTHFFYIDHNGQAGSLEISGSTIAMNGQFTLVDDLASFASGETLFTYSDGNGNTWTPADGFDDLYEVTITLRMESLDSNSLAFTHTVNPRNSSNLNAPKLQ
ncbi:prepilin-type N-terminal cleavage/methylation domain-containing protein [Desulfovibrio ferrophilus]|uniref:Prepilin-type N-terminal cleavage/methylation domain-containing protein n=1 Tax=Desulfovibrio ferrophilus TaxID=241368 RepID=A0A2Z6AZ34_9BACT|nr:prepilin-type N-terminal cleavage/methylation domain-containing protein [Desulfovibrio ferrophilus]BBD08527.1 uncharacterized protein DFE_1801 [Desulfovibrio ferrophilus]